MMGNRPTQAVILAGGRGTRLRPLTDTLPKAMVEICGKPFIEHQVELLCKQGFERVLLLLGYLPDVIQSYFGDGGRWGIKIDYSVTAPDDETSRRLKTAEPLLDRYFVLMYCDNYWPMRIDKMWSLFARGGAPAMITVYSNKDGYTRNSVRVEADGRVSIYDKSCAHPDLNGVEISYAILDRAVLGLVGDENVPVETVIYPRLAEERGLIGLVTDHRYYSVGSHHRLPLTREFFARRPTVILDRDGVLNKKPARASYVRRWEEFEWLPGAKKALHLLKQSGYRVIIASNQAGIARGALNEPDLAEIHERMRRDAQHAGGRIDAIYYCPHDWDGGCECRKPRPGLLFQAQRDFNLDLTRTLFMGDDERDAAAADQAGCPFVLVSEQISLLEWVRRLVSGALMERSNHDEEAAVNYGS